ncbi:MAG: BrnT family toxin [Treponema sp.]|nr:BrnT family toxin [Treponema sp.]
MGKVISLDGRFEWDDNKNNLNKKDHGFYFEEILVAFEDPFFLEAYDRDNSSLDEIRWKGIASFDRRIYFFISYTERDGRTRILSARLAEPPERERYDENYKKQITYYE